MIFVGYSKDEINVEDGYDGVELMLEMMPMVILSEDQMF